MHKTFVLASLALALPAALAQANPPGAFYRGGMPEVLAPAPAPAIPSEAAFHAGSFRSAYAKAGRPTIAVLWNREFSDMLEQSTVTMARADRSGEAIVAGHASRTANTRTSVGVAESRHSTVIQAGEVKTQQDLRAAPVENVDFQMRTAFLQAMASRGVKIVDRNVVMRTTARGRQGADTQHVETDALLRHAKLLMEILNTPDPAAATGWATMVTIKRMSDGQILALGYINGQGAAKGPQRFEANPNGGGFREVAAPVQQPADLGRMAAEHALARLGEALAR